MNLERLYLDYNATSPLSKSVLNWLKSGDLLFANPSSQHSHGKKSRKLINEARSRLYEVFGKSESSTALFFHSGATEAFTTFAHSFSEMARLQGKELLICSSSIDHPAVTSLAERYWGSHVHTYELKKNPDLTNSWDENYQALLDKKENNPDLIILYHHLWVHNETGLVSPLNDLQKMKSIPDLYVHVDAVQAPGKIPEWRELNEGDIWTFSAHKFGALKGIGFSFMKKSFAFYPLISGGGQQQNLRSGTENPQGVKSITLALDDLVTVDVEKTKSQREAFEAYLSEKLNGIGTVVKHQVKNSNTVYFYLHDLSSDVALALFDLNGLEISAGSACSSGSAKASPVLLHMGVQKEAKNGLRLSWGFTMSEEELQFLKSRLEKVLLKIRSSIHK